MKNLKEREALCSVSVWQSTHQINLGKRKKIQELLTHAGVKIWIRERNGYMLGVYSPSEQAIQDQGNLVQYKTLSQIIRQIFFPTKKYGISHNFG